MMSYHKVISGKSEWESARRLQIGMETQWMGIWWRRPTDGDSQWKINCQEQQWRSETTVTEYVFCKYSVQENLYQTIGKLGIVRKLLMLLKHLDHFQELKDDLDKKKLLLKLLLYLNFWRCEMQRNDLKDLGRRHSCFGKVVLQALDLVACEIFC